MAERVDFVMPESGGIQNYGELVGLCKKWLANGKKKKILIDLKEARKMDMAVLQVMAALLKECLLKDKHLRLIGPLDPILQDSLEEMDMVRMGADCPIFFEQIQGGIHIEC